MHIRACILIIVGKILFAAAASYWSPPCDIRRLTCHLASMSFDNHAASNLSAMERALNLSGDQNVLVFLVHSGSSWADSCPYVLSVAFILNIVTPFCHQTYLSPFGVVCWLVLDTTCAVQMPVNVDDLCQSRWLVQLFPFQGVCSTIGRWQADRVSSFYVSLRRANISLPTLSHSWGLMCFQSFPTPHLSEIGGVMNADGWYHLPFS